MQKIFLLCLLLTGCSGPEIEKNLPEATNPPQKKEKKDSILAPAASRVALNDSLTAIAQLMAGMRDSGSTFSEIAADKNYQNFARSFSARWHIFDSTRVRRLERFSVEEIKQQVPKEKVLFYPFSGPDILYANIFFPQAQEYILLGLEPVGSLPDFNGTQKDSLARYFNKLNTSLNAILKFSFFRTESMGKDLKNAEVDGTIHLLLLFLSRTGNGIISALPFTLDSIGQKNYLASFKELKSTKMKNKGVEIMFRNKDGGDKTLNYFSLNVADHALQNNHGFVNYLEQFPSWNVYLKGASYLLHKPAFSVLRKLLMQKAGAVVQDDSGIAIKYFLKEGNNWTYTFYGEYSQPIQMFAKQYQAQLDSLYKKNGSKDLDFGIGYNYRDKNSNFMIANKKM